MIQAKEDRNQNQSMIDVHDQIINNLQVQYIQPKKNVPPFLKISQKIISGEYRVALPDGRTQIVTYKADHYGGFVADVKYEGTAVYPPAPKGGYGPYKPAPAYAPA